MQPSTLWSTAVFLCAVFRAGASRARLPCLALHKGDDVPRGELQRWFRSKGAAIVEAVVSPPLTPRAAVSEMRTAIIRFHMLSLNLALLASLAAPRALVAQSSVNRVVTTPQMAPSDAGLSEEGLNAIADELRKSVAARELAGAVAVVMRGGREVYRVGVGFADVEAERPMRTDTIFRIASMTKPITSVAILQLEGQGKLSLNDPLSRFLPEFSTMQVLAPPPAMPTGELQTAPAQRPITIHDLLTHTSGLTYGFWGEEPLYSLYREAQVTDGLIEVPWTIAENARRLAALPLVAQPGTRWQYGLSTDVLGRVVEVASGESFEEYLRTHILDPLGMTDTHFVLPPEKHDRLGGLYQPDQEGKIQRTAEGEVASGTLRYSATYPLEQDRNYFSGGGGLVSTAGDYARFCQMLLNGGSLDDVRILTPNAVRRMTGNQIGDLSHLFSIHGDKFGYGFGVLTEQAGFEDPAEPGTYSWGGIFNTVFWVDPQQQLIGILMTQIYPHDHLNVREDFKRLMYEAITGPAPRSKVVSSEQPTPALGPQPGDVYREFSLHNGGNVDWRVTDPQATPERARNFLPNPQLKLHVGDLTGAIRAEALLDRWGGHTRTTAKQVRFNGNAWINVPEIASMPAGQRAEKFFSQDNPIVPVPLADLRTGENTVQGTCSTIEDYNWGQWGLYSLVLRVYYDPALQPVPAGRIVSPESGAELSDHPTIRVQADGPVAVDRVDVIAWYDGIDEDGDGLFLDWHEASFQPERGEAAALAGHVGTATQPPFEVRWDTTWVPDQDPGSLRLVARLRSQDGLWSVTPIVDGLSLVREMESVRVFRADRLPERFGVRVGETKSCAIPLPAAADVGRARMHVCTCVPGTGMVRCTPH